MPIARVDHQSADAPGRLRTPLLADEILVKARRIRIDAGDEPSSTLVRAGSVALALAGLDPPEVREVLAAVDGRATVRELLAAAPPRLGADGVRAVLQALVGFCLWVLPAARAPRPSLIVVDDFLEDPDRRRAEALRARYRPVPWFLYPGNYSEDEPDNIAAIMKRLEGLVGRKLYWGRGPIHGHYRSALGLPRNRAGANGIHTDPFSWNAVLCLSRDRDCRGGLSFYRHRRSRLVGRDGASLLRSGDGPEAFRDADHRRVTADGQRLERWHETGRVDVRWNRLILFDPRQYHNVNTLFGDSLATCRLTQGFSCFEADDPYRFEEWM
jgi:hypothetical protein